MKKFIFIILMIQVQVVSAQVLRPVFPYAGQNTEAEFLFRFGGPAINIQGLTNLVEFNELNIISLYVVHGSKVQSIHPHYLFIMNLAPLRKVHILYKFSMHLKTTYYRF